MPSCLQSRDGGVEKASAQLWSLSGDAMKSMGGGLLTKTNTMTALEHLFRGMSEVRR